ncbi:hypothetical protein D1164_06140 [Mariniphaga sediminis]|jgi:hypothetical protein|uniref:Uncharacterized protein n=1 Tax=Mariniphaga sediminis TaxID=1628158 RepID=A0A399D2P8_9BACT|nr:hypothetical protein [Mariniphaga sediminis]RIH65847.1 hypothetical protein D1164_06140 [Mariniphaga sediminis]
MEIIKVILLAVALVAIAMLGLATQILLKRGGKFPNTHVGGNKYLKKQGIACAQTQDKIERAKVEKKVDFKSVKIVNISK